MEHFRAGFTSRKKKLAPGEGMLFDFKEPKKISLWMKNTFIALDAIFIGNDGKIVDLKEHLKPKSKESIKSNEITQFYFCGLFTLINTLSCSNTI